MTRTTAAVIVLLAAGCGSEWHMPFSNANPTLPSNISIGTSSDRKSPQAADKPPVRPEGSVSLGVPRNVGTRVWLVPVPAGDMLRLAKEPALWVKARGRVDVFSFYGLHAYDEPGNPDWSCGVPCGPNTYPAFRDVVPGGMFKWLNDQGIQLSLETGSVKSHACTEARVREGEGAAVLTEIGNIERMGATVSFVKMDEPFFSGTNPVDTPAFGGCALSLAQTAQLVKIYVDTVHARFPHVQVGLIEPYPSLTPDTIISAMLELEYAGVPIPFFHLDMDVRGVVGQSADMASDVGRIRAFCAARGIPFGVIVTGTSGRSNEEFASSSWAVLRSFHATIGVSDDTVFQSWAESEPGNLHGRKYIPDTVPETSAVSHTGLLLKQLEYIGVRPVQ